MDEAIFRRRQRDSDARPHRVGPVRFSDQEIIWVTVAAERAGLARSAYIGAAAVAVATAEVNPPTPDEHKHLRALMGLRGELQQLAASIDHALANIGADQSPAARAHLTGTLAELDQAVRRVDETVSALLPNRAGQ